MWAERAGRDWIWGWEPSSGGVAALGGQPPEQGMQHDYSNSGEGILVETQALLLENLSGLLYAFQNPSGFVHTGCTEQHSAHSLGLDILVIVPTGFRADCGTLETPRRSSPFPGSPKEVVRLALEARVASTISTEQIWVNLVLSPDAERVWRGSRHTQEELKAPRVPWDLKGAFVPELGGCGEHMGVVRGSAAAQPTS